MDIREAIRANNSDRVIELMERGEIGDLRPIDIVRLIMQAREPRDPNRVLLRDIDLAPPPINYVNQLPPQPIAVPPVVLDPITIRLNPGEFVNYTTRPCAICMDIYNQKPIILTSCNHVFHLECIEISMGSSNKCPICRSPIVSIQPLNIDQESANNSEIRFSGGGMNYFEKYQKYKIKYLQLKN
jgi:hypothetical protein